MKKNDFPTNPIAFAQYVWENIEVGDTLVDRFHNGWKVASLTIYEGRKIRIYIRYIGSESYTNYNNGDFKKLTRYDLASKYYFYINLIFVKKKHISTINSYLYLNVYSFVMYFHT